MPWNSASGFPNCVRSRVYCTVASSAPRATPILCAPMPMRPSFSVSIAILYPCPTGPRTFAAGTTHPSRMSSVVLEARMPNLSSFLPTENPAKPRSTMNAVMPRYPAEGSTVANTMNISASAPFVIHNLRPVSTQSSPRRSARVANPNASDPEPGSDNAYAPTVPAVSFVRYCLRWASVPKRVSGEFTSVFCTSMRIADDASTRLTASTASVTIIMVPAAPPYSSGTAMPIRPSSKNSGINSGSSFPARSIACTRGRTCSSANAETASRNMLSSSDSTVSGARAASRSIVMRSNVPGRRRRRERLGSASRRDCNVRRGFAARVAAPALRRAIGTHARARCGHTSSLRFDACPLEHDFGELVVYAERRRHRDVHVRKGSSGLASHSRNVARRVLARRQHVREHHHVGRARLDACREALRDRRLRQFHVRDAHDRRIAGHGLHEMPNAIDHAIGGFFDRAVIDEQDGFHGLGSAGAAARRRRKLTRGPVEHVEGQLHLAERRGHLHTLHGLAHLGEHLARERNAFGQPMLLRLLARAPHPLDDGVRHHDTRHLVREELGVPRRDEGPDAGDHRNA